jgi:hypothetical protein
MVKLPLNDPRWASLHHRLGSAADVPARLQHLLNSPHDRGAFSELWPYLCSEDTTYSAAFAAAPYVLEIAERLPAGERFEHLIFLGLTRTYSWPDVHVPDFLADAYEDTRGRALALVGAELAFEHDPATTCYLLAAAAALKGYPKIAKAIECLDLIVERSMDTEIEG